MSGIKILLQMSAYVILGLFQFSIAIKNPVTTNDGKIKGTEVSYKGTKVQAFLGIPYAEPPVGNLRFNKTVPANPWSGCLQATHIPPACLQHYPPDYPWVDNSTLHSEDCLYLNIYVPPRTCKCSKKAVMFWIHSGGFSSGSGTLPVYDGRVLATEGDVIVVTINYRLGILGFVSSEEASGNMGLNDMLVALRWVNDNIAAFGGDPENITLFGQSAGGVAVGLMCVSQEAKGLFKRIIMQSGSAARNNIDNRKLNSRITQKVAEIVGCPPDGIIQCLKTKNAKELVDVTFSVLPTVSGISTIVGDDILKTDPKIALKQGLFNDADVLMGFTQDDGSFKLGENFPDIFGRFGEKHSRINKTFGKNLIRKLFEERPDKERIVQHYLGNLSEYNYQSVRKQTYHSIGDYGLICPAIYFGESYADKGKSVYAYYFNHIPSVTPWAHWMGSVHFDEVAFIFGRPLDHLHLYTSSEVELSRTLIRAWTNFAKYGSPGENWRKFSRSNQYFKVFNISNRKSCLEFHKKNCDFYRPFFGF